MVDQISLKLAKRFKEGSVKLDGKKISYTDAPSFVAMYEELFIHEIYKFKSGNPSPLIIDCGANIGLSVVYFKKLFPAAVIRAYEPDPHLFAILRDNLKSAGITGVELHQNAVWKENTKLSFVAQGGSSGHIGPMQDLDKTIAVEAVRLKDTLTEGRIDFLKIDIEGAEYEVLKDCAEELSRVETLFVEYHSMVNSEQQLDEILGIIKNAGFRYHIHPVLASPNPFIGLKTELDMDLQLNIFAYRS